MTGNQQAEPATSDPAGQDILVGTVERILYRHQVTGWTVARLEPAAGGGDAATLVGVLPTLTAGEVVQAGGAWSDSPGWGRRFEATRLTWPAGATAAAVAAFIGSGVVAGVGLALAQRLAEHFGEALAVVLEDAPERLGEVAGIGPLLQDRLAQAWHEHRHERDLLLFLGSHELGLGRAKPIHRAYGSAAVAKITADPYALSRDVRGFGFHTSDALARRLGHAADAPMRLRAALEQALRQAAEQGHTAMAEDDLLTEAMALTQADPAGLVAALRAAVAEGALAATITPAGSWVQLDALALAEAAVAERLRRLRQGPPPFAGQALEAALGRAEWALGLDLQGSQRAAVAAVLQAKVAVVTGGPGTGKTTLVRAILAALPDAATEVALCAPTGRAARRLSEATGRDARTIHRLLEADPGRGGFRRSAERPLEVELLVCDEASMVDLPLMAALLAALPDAAAVLFVGDADQLPSVGPGQVLADLIASGTVPVIRLTEVHRQAAAGGIARNALAINRGEPLDFAHGGETLAEFYGVRASGSDQAIATVVTLVAERIPERFGLDPLRDIQVLVPTNRGPGGVQALNQALAARLNPTPAAALPDGPYRLATGDRVMQIENDYERDLSNGDLGVIAAVDPVARTLQVSMDGRLIDYAADETDRLVPAFAITIHKAQGSEYPAVVLLLLREHGRMLRRRLFYTAVTRAKRLCVVVGDAVAIGRALQGGDAQARRTLLAHRLQAPETFLDP